MDENIISIKLGDMLVAEHSTRTELPDVERQTPLVPYNEPVGVPQKGIN